MEVVQVVVERRGVRPLEHVVALLLVPIQGLLRAVRAVGRVGWVAKIRIVTTTTGDLSRRQWGGRHGTLHVALEAIHVHLLRARVCLVDPEPRARALAVWALGHLLRDGEARVQIPHARVVYAEYGEILWLDLRDVRLVRDAQRAAAEIVDAVGVEFRRGLAGARIVRVALVALVATGAARPVGRRVFVAGYLEVNLASDRQLHNVLRVGRMVEMAVEPPLIERQVYEWLLGTVGIGDVEAPHARVPRASVSSYSAGQSNYGSRSEDSA